MASSTRSFGGVTQAIFECVKVTSEKEHGTVYTGSDEGTATTKTVVGDVVLKYDFDSAKETVTYTLVKKPIVVSRSTVWEGIQDAIDDCRQ